MYLTRIAGMSLRLPCKAVRNRKTLRQFVGAVIDRPRPTVKHNLTGNPSGEQCSPYNGWEKFAVYLTSVAGIET